MKGLQNVKMVEAKPSHIFCLLYPLTLSSFMGHCGVWVIYQLLSSRRYNG